MIKYLLLPLTFLFLLFGFLNIGFPSEFASRKPAVPQNSFAMCGAAEAGAFEKNENGKYVTALPGWGSYSFAISTENDSAQFYFNQGLNMYYGYHMKEANASFREASRFDPGNAMTYWGQALAMGPYYNAAWSYAVPESVKGVLAEMNKNMGNASAKEKHLIKAMNSRYPAEILPGKTKALDNAYASELKQLMEVFPEDPDVKTLYIDAVMLMHAWDFWNTDGTARAWTPEIADLCAKVLKFNPEHPAALHYQIHITEASRHPEVALANADALKRLFPGVPHMVHMASHEYQRNGLFDKGVDANVLAGNALLNYESLAKNLSLAKRSPHYYAVQSYCGLSGAMYKSAMQSSLKLREIVSAAVEDSDDEYHFMMPELTMVRLGKWNEVLADTVMPNSKWAYATLLHHFAKGMAYANTGKLDLAGKELSSLRESARDSVLKVRRIPFNAAFQMAGIAENMLQGVILFESKKTSEAIVSLNKAIALEDQLIYTEPNDWPLPVRQLLGVYLLKTGKRGAAQKVYNADLAMSPENGWSLIGLYQCATDAKKIKEMALYKTRYLKAFAAADEIPNASFYTK